jgi:ERCC4-related helicase
MRRIIAVGSKLTADHLRSQGLMPFQAEFAQEFCSSKSPAHWELIAPVGSGKTHLTKAIIACQVESGARRILVLAPKALLEQWQYVSRTSTNALDLILVDRDTYLELQSSVAEDQSPWPDAALILMSIDLAKKSDLTENLTEVIWDLVIIDESHLLTGMRRNLARKLIEKGRAKRSLFLTSIPGETFAGVKRKVWRFKDLLDWHDKTLFKEFSRHIVTLEYKRTKEEQRFLQTLEKIANDLFTKTQTGRIYGSLLVRAASSSIFTAETILRRLLEILKPIRNRIAHGMSITPEVIIDSQDILYKALDEIEPLEVPDQISFEDKALISFFQGIESLIDHIDDINVDSKFDDLYSNLLKRWQKHKKTHLCIWASFVSTVQYLTSSLEDIGIPMFSISSAIDWQMRKSKVDEFRKKGGILLTTDIAADEITGGIALGYVDECINYDLPVDQKKFEQRWGRFLRISRKTDFNMTLLKDTAKSLKWEDTVLKLIKESSSD